MDMNEIIVELSHFNPILYTFNSNNHLNAAFMIDSPIKKMNPDVLYICRDEEVLEQIQNLDLSGNVLFLHEDFFESKVFGKLNVISIRGTNNISDIYEVISQILSRNNDLENKKLKITKVFLESKGLKNLIHKGKEVFGNPMMICDLANNILACNVSEEISDLSWGKIEKDNVQNLDKLTKLHKSGVFERLYKSEIPAIEHFDYSPYRWMAYKIMMKGKLAGHVAIVESENSFHENDPQLLKFFSDIIAMELEKQLFQDYNLENSYEYILADLLDGRVKNKATIEMHFKSLNQRIHENIYVLTISKKLENSKQLHIKYIKNLVDKVLNYPKSIIYNDHLVIFVNHNKEEFLDERDKEKLVNLLMEYNLCAGISQRFHDISQIKKYYIQSYKAIELGQRIHRKIRLHKYADYSIYHFIDSIKLDEDVRGFCNPLIYELMEYDSIYSTDYCQTLLSYIENDMSFTKVAELYGFHRNTVKYRIKKIEEILNISIDNIDLKVSFYLSFKILRYLGKEI